MRSSSFYILHLVAQFSGALGILVSSDSETAKPLKLSERADSNLTTLTPQFFTLYGSKRTEIRYGPFAVDGMMTNNGMDNFEIEQAQMPCSDCLITWMQAGLTYPNGTYANANTSLWLHHTVLANIGVTDPVCGDGSYATQFFASGNERTVIDICQNGTQMAGYYIGPADQIGFQAELMNELMDPQLAIVTITYEYIPSPPAQFAKVTPIWLDIGNCNGSDVAPLTNTTFEYSMIPWKSTVQGRITAIGSHLHDGGINLMTMKNNKTMLCDAVASYGQTPGYIGTNEMSMSSSMGGMSMDNMTMTHVSSIPTCSGGTIEMGDMISITANYDFTKHMAMLNDDGSLMPVMGIAIAYVDTAVNMTSSSNATGNGTTGGLTASKTNPATSFAAPLSALIAAVLMMSLLQ